MSDATIEVVLDAGATIAESPTWSPSEAALYWVDIKKPALYRLHVASGEQRCWPLDADIGAFALDATLAGAVVALRTGLFHLNFTTGLPTMIAPPPYDPALFRFNEGSCDPTGRFWIGVMFDPLQNGAEPRPGALHSFTWQTGLRREADEAELHNGMSWSPHDARFYLSHSRTGAIWSFGVAADGLHDRRQFAVIPKQDGLPDGAAVDTNGGYWCALHGGSRLRRFTATGEVDRDIELPVSQPTMCAFGGAALDELYVTSASDGLTSEQRRLEPLAGALLRLRPGERGVVRRCTM